MAHQDAHNYAGKHPRDTTLDPRIAAALESRIEGDRISCLDAHKIAGDLNVTPAAVGVALDLKGCKISRCQLGMFGYGPQRIAQVDVSEVTPVMKKAIEEALIDSRLPCLSAWKIAEQFDVTKLELFAACEELSIKISSCQLGTF